MAFKAVKFERKSDEEEFVKEVSINALIGSHSRVVSFYGAVVDTKATRGLFFCYCL